MKLIYAVALLACSSAQATTILYDTFNEQRPDDNLYDCCNYIQVGSHHGKAQAVRVSVPFAVPIKTKIVEIDIPLFTDPAGARFKVEVIGENGNKHAFFANALPGPGQCCDSYSVLTAPGVAVAPGVQYSIYVHRLGRAQGGWQLNTIDAVGEYTVWDRDGEHLVNSMLPAMRIIGR